MKGRVPVGSAALYNKGKDVDSNALSFYSSLPTAPENRFLVTSG